MLAGVVGDRQTLKATLGLTGNELPLTSRVITVRHCCVLVWAALAQCNKYAILPT
jgi:hypothetical protein